MMRYWRLLNKEIDGGIDTGIYNRKHLYVFTKRKYFHKGWEAQIKNRKQYK